jgi:hypothetical protein
LFDELHKLFRAHGDSNLLGIDANNQIVFW